MMMMVLANPGARASVTGYLPTVTSVDIRFADGSRAVPHLDVAHP
jgi:hypothetical protein